MQSTKTLPKQKSDFLTSEEKQLLRRFVKSFPYTQRAAETIGVSRQVLDRVLVVGSGSPDSIAIIRQKLVA